MLQNLNGKFFLKKVKSGYFKFIYSIINYNQNASQLLKRKLFNLHLSLQFTRKDIIRNAVENTKMEEIIFS